MKKLPALFYAIACTVTVFSCIRSHHGNTSLTYNESDHYYSLNARFSESKTRDVEHYIDYKIGRRSNMSFLNSQIDGTVALDDHTTFYIKKTPGILKIKLNKKENSDEAYERIRSMCEGIKTVLVK